MQYESYYMTVVCAAKLRLSEIKHYDHEQYVMLILLKRVKELRLATY